MLNIIKNKSLYIAPIFFILIVSFLFFSNSNKIKAQGSNQIKLFVYPFADYSNLGNMVEVGTRNINTNNDFNKFYNISPLVTVLNKSFYRLVIPATTNINLRFRKIEPQGSGFVETGDKNCADLNGRIENNQCIIEGMINTDFSNNSNYELWQILARSASGNNFNDSIYFYIVSSSTALGNNSNRNDQYYLIPEATSVRLTNSQPTTMINYSIYYKKLYCPNNLANAQSHVSSTPSGFGSFSFNNEEFGGQIFINRQLSLDRVSSGRYYLYLIQRGGNFSNRISFNSSTITVDNQITQPTLSLACRVNPTSGLRIGSSSTYILEASSNQTINNATFTLVIASSSHQLYKSISIFVNSNNYSTSVEWTASGTYYSTATVETLGIGTSTTCPNVSVETCNCVFRGSVGGWQIRCRLPGGEWENWRNYGGHQVDPNCNCDTNQNLDGCRD